MNDQEIEDLAAVWGMAFLIFTVLSIALGWIVLIGLIIFLILCYVIHKVIQVCIETEYYVKQNHNEDSKKWKNLNIHKN